MSTYDNAPVWSDLTVEDAQLFAPDPVRSGHDAATCTVEGCWVCAAETPLGGAA